MIRILDEATINQIAAGEVIENPASVIKELIENAIDAKASSIIIETTAAGRALIRVIDDGIGMTEEELHLAILRHATSKITNVNDLESIASLGFRGEALPSIASVSKMTIQSSTGTAQGHQIEVVGGKVERIKGISRTRGTTVEVRSLFFNVPVRRKFQKSLASDVAEIHRVITKIALSYPDLDISWKHDDHMKYSLSKLDTKLERIKILLGEEFASNLFEVEEFGFLSKPSFHRPNRTGQYISVNNRPIFSTFLSQVIARAYHTALPEGRFPLFVLSLHLKQDLIDVNVHPQKKEVRFREEEEIERLLFSAVSTSLQRYLRPIRVERVQAVEAAVCAVEVQHAVSKATEENFFRQTPNLAEVVGVLGNYILVKQEGALALYDIEAIHYRLNFEKLENSAMGGQMLLFPQTIEVSEGEKLLLNSHIEQLGKVGISMRPFGDRTFLIDAIPAHLEVDEVESLLHELIDDKFLHLPHKVAKRGQRRELTPLQAAYLIQSLQNSKEPTQTPEGKPISVIITMQEVKKRFG